MPAKTCPPCSADCNEGRACPARLAATGCSSCNGKCPYPEACHLPERPRTFRPDFGIEGPERRVSRARFLLLATAAAVGGSFLVGAIGRLTGAL